MRKALSGQGAVVVGGGRGIGQACAEFLAAEGARVVISARTQSQIVHTVLAIRKRGGRAWAVPCDVTKPENVRTLARLAGRHLKSIDILVNSAGIAPTAPLAKLSLREWHRTIAVNLTGTFLAMQAFLPELVRRRGRVVNIASTAALEGGGGPYIAAYAAAKHGVLGLTRSAAAELSGVGVRVNAVCPGFVDTDLTRQSVARIVQKTGKTPKEALRLILNSVHQKRLITPREVARAVAKLCLPSAKATGQAVVLHGRG